MNTGIYTLKALFRRQRVPLTYTGDTVSFRCKAPHGVGYTGLADALYRNSTGWCGSGVATPGYTGWCSASL
jgi:hypothetical protein